MTERGKVPRPAGGAHQYTDPNGVEWTFTARPQVRHTDDTSHVVLLIESAWETRGARCLHTDWEVAAPDYARILGASLPAGGSRGLGPRDEHSDTPPPEQRF